MTSGAGVLAGVPVNYNFAGHHVFCDAGTGTAFDVHCGLLGSCLRNNNRLSRAQLLRLASLGRRQSHVHRADSQFPSWFDCVVSF